MSSSDVVITQGGKTSWPEVVGKPVEEAKAIIHRDRPDVHIVILLVGTAVTKDFNPLRVRVFVNMFTKPPQPEEIDMPDTENFVVPIGVEIVVKVPHVG